MKPTLYLETTVPSYLTAWPSRDLIRAGHQQITKEWWQARRAGFDISPTPKCPQPSKRRAGSEAFSARSFALRKN